MNKNSKIKTALVSSLFIMVSSHSIQAYPVNEENVIIKPIKTVIESPKQKLMSQLDKLKFFSADFTQLVVDQKGKTLQKGSGRLVVSKPNLVHWKTIEPDETLIVSDGQNLWFYDPFIEEVKVYLLENAVADTPILLLTTSDKALWEGYSVSQISTSTFLIHSLDSNSQIKSLELIFDENNALTKLSLLDATGQLSHFTLNNVDYKNIPDKNLFQFIVPEGISIDDQR